MFFIVILTMALILVSMFVVMIILMQRPNEETGLGATLGEGSVATVFGGDAVNVLARWTRWCVGFFYLASFLLAMIYMAREHRPGKPDDILPKKVAVDALAKFDDSEGPPAQNDDLNKSNDIKKIDEAMEVGSIVYDSKENKENSDLVNGLEHIMIGADEPNGNLDDSDETPGGIADELSE
jgi:protein translocase SecG subunit